MMPSPLPNSGSVSTSVVAGSEFYIHPVAKETVPTPVSRGVSGPTEHCATPVAIVKEHSVRSSSEPQLNRTSVMPARYFRVKKWIDRFITAGLSLLAIPLMTVVAIAVLILDGRPIFFRQVRVGKDGNLFQIWKFRTMHRDAEACTGAVWSSEGDTRVTGLGRWLRQTHLDELPQFLNVLSGDMNLIGPRPERPEFVERLSTEIPDYDLRSQVRPGITGLAQLRLGYDESIEGVPRKIQCDLEYIYGTSFVRDFVLLIKTIPHIILELVKAKLYTAHRVNKNASIGNSVDTTPGSRMYIHSAERVKRKTMPPLQIPTCDSEVA